MVSSVPTTTAPPIAVGRRGQGAAARTSVGGRRPGAAAAMPVRRRGRGSADLLLPELFLYDFKLRLLAARFVGRCRATRAGGADEGGEEGGGPLGLGGEGFVAGRGGGEAQTLLETGGALALAAELVVVSGRLLLLHFLSVLDADEKRMETGVGDRGRSKPFGF